MPMGTTPIIAANFGGNLVMSSFRNTRPNAPTSATLTYSAIKGVLWAEKAVAGAVGAAVEVDESTVFSVVSAAAF